MFEGTRPLVDHSRRIVECSIRPCPDGFACVYVPVVRNFIITSLFLSVIYLSSLPLYLVFLFFSLSLTLSLFLSLPSVCCICLTRSGRSLAMLLRWIHSAESDNSSGTKAPPPSCCSRVNRWEVMVFVGEVRLWVETVTTEYIDEMSREFLTTLFVIQKLWSLWSFIANWLSHFSC